MPTKVTPKMLGKQAVLKTAEDQFIAMFSGPKSEFAEFEKSAPNEWQALTSSVAKLFSQFSSGAVSCKKRVNVRIKAETKQILEQMSKDQGKSQTRVLHEAIRYRQLVVFASETEKQFPQFVKQNDVLWAKFLSVLDKSYRALMALE